AAAGSPRCPARVPGGTSCSPTATSASAVTPAGCCAAAVACSPRAGTSSSNWTRPVPAAGAATPRCATSGAPARRSRGPWWPPTTWTTWPAVSRCGSSNSGRSTGDASPGSAERLGPRPGPRSGSRSGPCPGERSADRPPRRHGEPAAAGATRLATVPLLSAKLWSVYPRLFSWPPARTVVHAVERGSVAVLVAAALFQVVTGILNVARWYPPMGFFFTTAHYWTAWLAIGALLLHIAVQLPVIRRGLADRTPPPPTGGLTRRGLLATVAGSAALITVATAGETVP